MPTYDYECRTCGQQRPDVFHKLEENGPVCETCRAPMFRKMGAPSAIFRGGGWASDGYASQPKDSIPAADFEGAMLRAAQEGTKAGGEKEGQRRALQARENLLKKYGTA